MEEQADGPSWLGHRVDKEGPAGQNEIASRTNGSQDLESACRTSARVAELADALASGASDRKVVEVRVLSRAPILCRTQS
jgi:hypothetical protein